MKKQKSVSSFIFTLLVCVTIAPRSMRSEIENIKRLKVYRYGFKMISGRFNSVPVEVDKCLSEGSKVYLWILYVFFWRLKCTSGDFKMFLWRFERRLKRVPLEGRSCPPGWSKNCTRGSSNVYSRLLKSVPLEVHKCTSEESKLHLWNL